MNYYEKFTRDIVITGITNLVIALRGLILLPILSKTLGTAGYGIWAQVTVTLFLVSCFSTLNLGASLARFLAAERDKGKIREGFFSVAVTGLGSSLLIAGILFFLSNSFASALLHDPEAVHIVRLMALIIPFWALETTYLGFFRAFREMRTYSFLLILRNFLELGLIAYFVLSGRGVFGAVLALLIARVIVDAIMLSVIIARIGVKWPAFSGLRQYLGFSTPLIPGMMAAWATSSSDRYVIGILLGMAPVGIYSAGYSLGSIISFLAAPLAIVLMPTLSHLYDENRIAEVKTHLSYSLKYFLLLAIPAVFGLAVLARPLLHSLTTLEFVATGSLVVPFIAAGYLLQGVYIIFLQVYILAKETRIIGILWGGVALLNVVLNIIFVPIFGVLAAAATTLISYTLVTVVVVFVSTRHLEFYIEWAFIAKSVVASVLMSLVVWRFSPVGIVNILMVAGLGAVVYFVVLFLGRGFALNEVKFFRQFIQGR